MAIVALATGRRESNLADLELVADRPGTWNRGIYGDKAKGKEDIHVSLSDAAI